MENHIKMTDQEVLDVLKAYKNKSNKDLMGVMDFLQGDFEKATAYAAPIQSMKLHTANTEKNYRDLDKEGRSNFRQASIIILGITDKDSLHTQMNYQYSLDKKPRQLEIEKKSGSWFVVAVKE